MVVHIVDRLADVALARDALRRGMEGLEPLDPEPVQLVLAGDTVAGAILRHLEESSGGMVLMSSHGRGRSAAVLGSMTTELFWAMSGPVIVVGPHVSGDAGEVGGNYVVPLDGSTRSDGVLPIVGAWTVEFGGTPWLVEVLDDAPSNADHLDESSLVRVQAADLRSRIDRPVEVATLHGRHVARSILEFAEAREATLVFMATHGRTGADRLRCGSVAADVVRHTTCPVVMFRPPDLPSAATAVGTAAGRTGG